MAPVDRPWFILVGGINGAGKSTVAQDPSTLSFLTGEIGGSIEVINPDKVTQDLRARNPGIPLQEANVLAARACEQRVDELIRATSQSFAIETVLSTDKYRERVLRARRSGFEIVFIYLLLESVESAIKRVRLRVSRGGHDVPEEKVRARWPRSLANVPWFWANSTAAFIYLNEITPVKLAERRGDEGRFNLSPPDCAKNLLASLLPLYR